MKKNKRPFILIMGILIFISLLQLNTPLNSAKAAKTTINTDTSSEEESDSEPNPVPDPNPPPEKEDASTPIPPSEPKPEQIPVPVVPTKPKPEIEANEPVGSSPGGNTNSKPTINQKPVQTNKPTTPPKWAPARTPVRTPSSNSVESNWTPPIVPSNNSTKNNVETQTTTNEPTDEIIVGEPESKEEVKIEEEIKVKVNVEDFSIEELIQMIERGEAKGEVKGDKYFLIFEDDLENREVTKEEAIKLGIIKKDIKEETAVEIDENPVDDVSDPIEIVTDVKSEKGKMPLYISSAGLATVIIGALMYFVQLRRSSK